MEEKDFKNQFIACFLASWCANKYEYCCARGEQAVLGSPPVEDAEEMAGSAWEEILKNCNIESYKQRPPKEWVNLYHAVNKMMMTLGIDGEINASQDVAGYVMESLAAIDGGQYDTDI